MNIKSEYERLYERWLKELETENIYPLTDAEFNRFKNNKAFLQNFRLNHDDEIKSHVFKVIKNNFNFLFNDLLELRKQKILDVALSVQELDVKALIEPEKLLYQNIMSSLKGYEKVLRHSLHEIQQEMPISSPPSSDTIQKDIKSEEISEKTLLEKCSQTIPSTSPPPHLPSPSLALPSSFPKTDIIRESTSSKHPSQRVEQPEEKYEYMMVRFIKETPALAGIDLLNYGPFEKEDIAYLPSKNAKILISEKFAKPLNIE
ncbi:MAG: DNA replication complex subunit Gins51 [Promethearchaeota archaeon]